MTLAALLPALLLAQATPAPAPGAPSRDAAPAGDTPTAPAGPAGEGSQKAGTGEATSTPTPTSNTTSTPTPLVEPGDGRPLTEAERAARLAHLEESVRSLQQQLDAAEAALVNERVRSDALDSQVQAHEGAAAEAARSPAQQRNATLGAALGGMGSAQDSLAVGDPNGVDEQLAQTQGDLAGVRAQAGAHGAEPEARNADVGTMWIGAAREALARGDLWQARVALAQASAFAAGARALAVEAARARAAGGAGATPPPGPAPSGY